MPKTLGSKNYLNKQKPFKFIFFEGYQKIRALNCIFSSSRNLKKLPTTTFEICGFTAGVELEELSTNKIKTLTCKTGVSFHGSTTNNTEKLLFDIPNIL